MSDNSEEKDIDGSSPYKDYKHEFKFEKHRFSIGLDRSALVEEHP